VTCNTIRLWKWNAFGGAAPTYQGSVTVNDYGEPPNAVQPGTRATIATNDVRELGAYWAYDTTHRSPRLTNLPHCRYNPGIVSYRWGRRSMTPCQRIVWPRGRAPHRHHAMSVKRYPKIRRGKVTL
jgi:hypothetical protein